MTRSMLWTDGRITNRPWNQEKATPWTTQAWSVIDHRLHWKPQPVSQSSTKLLTLSLPLLTEGRRRLQNSRFSLTKSWIRQNWQATNTTKREGSHHFHRYSENQNLAIRRLTIHYQWEPDQLSTRVWTERSVLRRRKVRTRDFPRRIIHCQQCACRNRKWTVVPLVD